MAVQTHKTRAETTRATEQAEGPVKTKEEDPAKREAELAASEAVLDDIDELLEELGLNTEEEAAAFLIASQQKGGE